MFITAGRDVILHDLLAVGMSGFYDLNTLNLIDDM